MIRKKKIAIIGAGNAACITAMHYYLFGTDAFDIEIYYDPDIPIEAVGQGTTIPITGLIYHFCAANWSSDPLQMENYIKATHKEGILYENWGKKKEKIFHPFPLNELSIHYVPSLLSKLVLESKNFKVIEKNINDPETEIDCDYIFDCRGKENRNPKLYEELINPLNSVILSKKEGKDPNLTYTRCVATPDGWTFIIPNYDSVSYGYLFNDNITNLKKAEKNFTKLFDVVPDTNFKFENYIAKKCIHGERTILNGNRLAFLEPLEATSTYFYQHVARCAWEYMFGNVDERTFNSMIKDEMKKIQTFVLWHYQNGSKYDTPFWDYAKTLKFSPDKQFKQTLKHTINKKPIEILRDPNKFGYSQWESLSFLYWNQNT